MHPEVTLFGTVFAPVHAADNGISRNRRIARRSRRGASARLHAKGSLTEITAGTDRIPPKKD